MKYTEFEKTISQPRMSRYLLACSGDTKKAMTLYRLNLRLSQELFTTISCFEIALRNAIDRQYTQQFGNDWLKDAVLPNGIFDNIPCRKTAHIITVAHRRLQLNYSHPKLLPEMDFGFWRYLFAQPQFFAGGQTLLRIFPAKPRSTPSVQYNHSYVFNELEKINALRNRIAHHEPICFALRQPVIDTIYIKQHYRLILDLFNWMHINERELLYGLDHVNTIIGKIDAL